MSTMVLNSTFLEVLFCNLNVKGTEGSEDFYVRNIIAFMKNFRTILLLICVQSTVSSDNAEIFISKAPCVMVNTQEI